MSDEPKALDASEDLRSLNADELKPLKEVKNFNELRDRYFMRALKTLSWNRTHTAKAMGISIRCLRSHIVRMRRLGWYIPESPNGRRNETPH